MHWVFYYVFDQITQQDVMLSDRCICEIGTDHYEAS